MSFGCYCGYDNHVPLRRAISTASLTSFGLDCQVPRPTAGILSPVLRVKVLLKGAVCELYVLTGKWDEILESRRRILLPRDE
jgi:hypothetical protein